MFLAFTRLGPTKHCSQEDCSYKTRRYGINRLATVLPTRHLYFKAGKTVLVAAHGNSIRAMVKMLEGLSDEVIPGLEIPTGTPLVYDLDADLKPLPTDLAVPPLTLGRYLGDAEAIKAAAEAVKNQTKVG